MNLRYLGIFIRNRKEFISVWSTCKNYCFLHGVHPVPSNFQSNQFLKCAVVCFRWRDRCFTVRFVPFLPSRKNSRWQTQKSKSNTFSRHCFDFKTEKLNPESFITKFGRYTSKSFDSLAEKGYSLKILHFIDVCILVNKITRNSGSTHGILFTNFC